MQCASCGAVAAEDARFCASCGRPLRAEPDERRVVSVLFADLVGFTGLSERLDPEQVKDLVDRCFDRLAAEVTAYGGQVDKIVGDAMVALFGATTAHEDDPERAVRAALRMQVALAEEASGLGHELRMRVGVNTGEVLVGAMRAAGSVTAMGDVVNTASRLQTSAAPGEVLVGPATHAATRHTIAYEPRGPIEARGRDERVEAWAAVAPTLPPGSRPRRVDVPFVGRAAELDLLRSAATASVRHERALLALVVGDVGMGKTRLVDELARWAADEHGAIVREGRCVPYGEANVWWPVADALRPAFGLADGASRVDARAAVLAGVASAMGEGGEVARTADGLLTLLGYEPTGDQDPVVVREEAGRALGAYAAASARHRPLVLQISDLHWADPAVLTLLDDVMGAVHRHPVVVLATARSALLDQWTPRAGRHNGLLVHLDPLARRATAELLAHLVGAPVPDAVADALHERSGGNPFFLEELVSLLDGEAALAPGHVAALPDTLRGLVSARLDDLTPDARTVLQDASVIGQRGPLAGLREMGRKLGRPADVDAAVAELVAHEVLSLDGELWAFRSDLVREVAYQTITKGDRASTHLGIAAYLEAATAALDPQPPWVVDQLAHHYGAAVALAAELGPNARTSGFPDDLDRRARRWVTAAADRAGRDQALPAAVRLYTQALGLLRDDDLAERTSLLLRRSAAAAEGWDLELAQRDAEGALAGAEALGDPAAAARAVVALGGVRQKQGDVDGAVATLADAADRFRALGDVGGVGEALRQRAMVEIFGERLADAEVSATAALAALREAGDRAGEGWAHQNLAWTAFVTGRPDEADAHLSEALACFEPLADTRGLAWSLGLLAWVRFQQRSVDEAAELADRVLAEAEARSDPWATSMMTLLAASVRLWTGRTEEAVELAERAARTFTAIGDRYGRGQASAVLARAMVMAGRVDEGIELLERWSDGGGAMARIPRFVRAAVALQVGMPELVADDVWREIEAGRAGGVGGIDGPEPLVALAVRELQAGRPAAARELLASAPPETATAPSVQAAWSLVEAASGGPGSGARADAVAQADGATYLDRALAEVGAALAAATSDTGAGEAAHRISLARAAVHATEDRPARAVVELAAAAVSARLDLPERDEVAAHAEHLVATLGVEATGWRRAFALATRTSVP